MSELTASRTRLDAALARLDAFVRRHSSPLVLACMLGAALIVWMIPAATETRCMMVQKQGLGLQGAVSLSVALTALAWWAHKPALRYAAALRRTKDSTPTD